MMFNTKQPTNPRTLPHEPTQMIGEALPENNRLLYLNLDGESLSASVCRPGVPLSIISMRGW